MLSSILILSCFFGEAQEAKDLFKASDVPICWLGVDFSHVKLIGDFTEFSSAGEKNVVEIRDKYFPKWNQLILAEPDNRKSLRTCQDNAALHSQMNTLLALTEANES